MTKYPKSIFEKETLEQKEDRRAMEGKILIYDKKCKCGNCAQFYIKGKYLCKNCHNTNKMEVKLKKWQQ